MADLKQIAETLVNLTVKEVSELATILKDEYGIEPAAAAPVHCRTGDASASHHRQRQRASGELSELRAADAVGAYTSAA